jgi:hypothetical protein
MLEITTITREVTIPAKPQARWPHVHFGVPVVQAEAYRKGWTDYYWTPLKEHFTPTS